VPLLCGCSAKPNNPRGGKRALLDELRFVGILG
jgi:hypothetical protein